MSGSADERIGDPRPLIEVDGQDKEELRQGLLSLSIVETTEGLFRLEATFGNYGENNQSTGFLYFDRQTFDFGKSLAVKLGDDYLFSGKITAIEGKFPAGSQPEIVILAEDALQNLRMTRRSRTFSDMSDAAVFQQIAGDHGLTPNIQFSGKTHKTLAQINQSDLAFIRERARAVELELWVSDSNGQLTLNAVPRASRPSGQPLKLGWQNELEEFSVIADLAHQRTSVAASGWDYASKSDVNAEATDSEVQNEVGGDESGASILRTAFGDRKEVMAHGAVYDREEADERAKAYFRMSARRFLVGRGIVRTNPKLKVGIYVDLDGLGPLFNGKYYLAEVRHRFDPAKGLRSEIIAERAGLGRP